MKQALISAAVAAVVSVVAFALLSHLGRGGEPAAAVASDAAVGVAAAGGSVELSVSVEPSEDSWVSGARQFGADERLLSSAASSACFLTKVEVGGMQGPEDRGSCRVAIDEFTGFWKVIAEVPEGSRSEIRCNARCLSFE